MENIVEEIAKLRRERKAVVLAHNYCRGEVQDIADFTGDSLELARRAAGVDADVIVFCGVYFMAETAAILNPGKTVLVPDETAGCPMADMITAEQLRALKAKHPGAAAVCYVNSTAEVKAECDICVTSGNAERVMKTFPKDREIIFVPDQHLGSHIAGLLGTEYVLWPGYCPTHARLTAKNIEDARAAHPGAPVMVHPECRKDVRDAADERLSTGGMCAFARTSAAKGFVVGTEDMTKARFTAMSLMPTILFGFIPFVLFFFFPSQLWLGLTGAFNIGAGTGDFINVYNALTQMPKGALTYMSGHHSFWYVPKSNKEI